MADIGVQGITGAEQIGQGAFGRVYRAEQADLNRVVAVKVLANVDLNEEARTRFAREARAIGRMSGHPNIVNVYTQGTTTDGTPYLIMEFCADGSLGDRIRDGARMSWQQATEALVAVAGALQTAHAAGILHRDIKPANILLDSYGTPKLADFGIARMGTDASVTATGMLTGSPAHIAPELIAGEHPSVASDVYSLGSTLFTLITGRPPFHRETDTSILSLLQRISAEPAPYLAQWGVPPAVADLVAATLAKNPAQRPPTCRDFAQALMQARTSLGLPPGDYRVDRHTAGDSNATVLPGRVGPPGPPGRPGFGTSTPTPAQPVPPSVAATLPSAQYAPAGFGQAHSTGAVGVVASPLTSLPDEGHRHRTMLILLCWLIVAICLLLAVAMLWNRTHELAGLVVAYSFIGG